MLPISQPPGEKGMSWLSKNDENRSSSRGGSNQLYSEEAFRKKESQLNERLNYLESSNNKLKNNEESQKREINNLLATINRKEDETRCSERQLASNVKEKQNLKLQIDSLNLEKSNSSREREKLSQKALRLENEKAKFESIIRDHTDSKRNVLAGSIHQTSRQADSTPISTLDNPKQFQDTHASATQGADSKLQASPATNSSPREIHRPSQDENDLRKKFNALNTQCCRLENEKISMAKIHARERDELKEKLKETQLDLTQMRNSFDEHRKSKVAEYEVLAKAHGAEKSGILKNLDDLAFANNRLKEDGIKMSIIETALEKADSKLIAQTLEYEQLQNRLEKENSTRESTLNTLQCDHAKVLEQNIALMASNEVLRTRSIKLEQSSNVDLNELEELENEKIALKAQICNVRGNSNKLDNKVLDLEQQIVLKEAAFTELKIEKCSLVTALSETKKESSSIQMIHDEMNEELNIIKGVLLNSETTREELDFQNEKLKAELALATNNIVEGNDAFQKELACAKDRHLKLENGLQDFSLKKVAVELELSEARRSLQIAEESSAVLVANSSILLQRIEMFEKQIEKLGHENKFFLDQKDQLVKHLDLKEIETAERIGILQNAIKRSGEKVDELTLQLKITSGDRDINTKSLSDSIIESSKLELQVEQHRIDFDKLAETHSRLTSRLSESEATLMQSSTSLGAEISQLKRKLAERESMFNELHTTMSISQATGNMEQIHKLMAQAKDQLNANANLELTIGKIKSELETSKKTAGGLSSKLTRSQADLSIRQEEYEDMEAMYLSLVEKFKIRDLEARGLEHQLFALQESFAERDMELNSARLVNQTIVKEFIVDESMARRIAMLEKEKDGLIVNVATSDQTISIMRDELQTMTDYAQLKCTIASYADDLLAEKALVVKLDGEIKQMSINLAEHQSIMESTLTEKADAFAQLDTKAVEVQSLRTIIESVSLELRTTADQYSAECLKLEQLQSRLDESGQITEKLNSNLQNVEKENRELQKDLVTSREAQIKAATQVESNHQLVLGQMQDLQKDIDDKNGISIELKLERNELIKNLDLTNEISKSQGVKLGDLRIELDQMTVLHLGDCEQNAALTKKYEEFVVASQEAEVRSLNLLRAQQLQTNLLLTEMEAAHQTHQASNLQECDQLKASVQDLESAKGELLVQVMEMNVNISGYMDTIDELETKIGELVQDNESGERDHARRLEELEAANAKVDGVCLDIQVAKSALELRETEHAETIVLLGNLQSRAVYSEKEMLDSFILHEQDVAEMASLKSELNVQMSESRVLETNIAKLNLECAQISKSLVESETQLHDAHAQAEISNSACVSIKDAGIDASQHHAQEKACLEKQLQDMQSTLDIVMEERNTLLSDISSKAVELQELQDLHADSKALTLDFQLQQDKLLGEALESTALISDLTLKHQTAESTLSIECNARKVIESEHQSVCNELKASILKTTEHELLARQMEEQCASGIADNEASRAELANRITQMHNDNIEHVEKIAHLEGQACDLKNVLASHDQTIGKLYNELEAAKTVFDMLMEEKQRVDIHHTVERSMQSEEHAKNIEILKSTFLNDSTLDALQAVKPLHIEISKLEAEIIELSDKHQHVSSELSSSIDIIERLKSAHTGNSARVESLDQQIELLNQEMIVKDSSVLLLKDAKSHEDVQMRLAEATTKLMAVPSLESSLELKNVEAKRLHDDIVELQARNNQADQIIQTKTSYATRLECDVKDLQYSIKELNANVDVLTEKSSIEKQSIETFKMEISSIRNEIKMVCGDRDGLRGDLEIAESKYNAAKNNLESQATLLEEQKCSFSCLELDFGSVQKENAELQARLVEESFHATAVLDVEALQKTNHLLESRLESLLDRPRQLECEVETGARKNALLEAEIKDLNLMLVDKKATILGDDLAMNEKKAMNKGIECIDNTDCIENECGGKDQQLAANTVEISSLMRELANKKRECSRLKTRITKLESNLSATSFIEESMEDFTKKRGLLDDETHDAVSSKRQNVVDDDAVVALVGEEEDPVKSYVAHTLPSQDRPRTRSRRPKAVMKDEQCKQQ